jgi:hypothetical protein
MILALFIIYYITGVSLVLYWIAQDNEQIRLSDLFITLVMWWAIWPLVYLEENVNDRVLWRRKK